MKRQRGAKEKSARQARLVTPVLAPHDPEQASLGLQVQGCQFVGGGLPALLLDSSPGADHHHAGIGTGVGITHLP